MIINAQALRIPRGLITFFYSNEHEPIHVHGQCEGRESKAEFVLVEGEVVEIRIAEVKGSRPLTGKDLQNFKKLVEVYAQDIVAEVGGLLRVPPQHPARNHHAQTAMRIVETAPTDSPQPVLAVIAAEPVGPYALRLTFNTAEERTVDFGDFLRQAQHPAVRAYLDENRFRQFALVNGNVNWNDYDLIFPIADLYAGKVT